VEAFGTVSPTKFVNIRMQLGDQLLLNAPGGGGYGDPKERSEEQIEADLVDGFISIDGRDLYGRQ
jgi:N-methylhydantoinase B/oxoprolinase/acetone carboxylase alpha subunit